jgi:iron complex outermembrane receptor protein
MRKGLVVAGATLVSVAGLMTGGTNRAMAAAADAASSTGPGDELQEVVVTAERREEDLQKVPVSTTVIDSQQMQELGLQTTESIRQDLPNVTLAATSFFGREQGVFRMRGIPNVTVYVDGIPEQETFGYFGDLVELDRVEVLRGPQGTLFGKNSMGGAIQYVTKDPASTFGARLSTTYGSFDRFNVTGSVDIPLADTLLTKLTVAKLSSNGYLPSQEANMQYGSQDDLVARYDVLWKPTENFTWKAAVNYVENRTNGNPSTLNLLPTGVGSLAGIYDGIGLTIPSACTYGATQQFKTCSEYQGPELYVDTLSYSTQLDFKINNNWAVRGIGGVRRIADQGFADFSSVPYHLFEGNNYNDIQESTEEVQLLFNSSPLIGTVGFFSYHDDKHFRRENWFDNEWYSPAINATLYDQVEALIGATPPFTKTPPVGPGNVDQLTYTFNHGNAEYTQWTWNATDKLSVTAGVRFNDDVSTTANYLPLAALPLLCCEASPGTATNGGAPTSSVYASATETAPRVSVQYQWTPVIMTYATYGIGFNQGGGTATSAGVVPYKPERVANYELGLRSDLLDHHLRANVSVFYDDYSDIQVSQDINFFNVTTNGGGGEAKGFEAEGMWLIGGGLSLQYGLGFAETDYTSVPPGNPYASGTPFPYAPKWQNNTALQYDFMVPNGGGVTLRGEYNYQSSMYTGTVYTGSAAVYIPTYALVGARVTYHAPGGKWELQAFGTNLGNKFYEINGYNIAGVLQQADPGRPRELGLTFNFKFN